MNLSRVLIVDLETSALEPENGQVLEAAGVLFDVPHAEVIEARSMVVYATRNPCASINGLAPSFLRSIPRRTIANDDAEEEFAAFDMLYDMSKHADAFVAHRASFEMKWLPRRITDRLPFICTKFGCDWPRGRFGDHLAHLAVAHGVPVTGAHRALGDCMLIAGVMRAANEHWASHHRNEAGTRAWEVRALPAILEQAIERGAGDPPRCSHGAELAEPHQCPNYVRTYQRSPLLRRCPQHGGSAGWVS